MAGRMSPGFANVELEQAQEPLHPRVVDVDAIVQVVEQRARLGVEPDVPDPALVVDLALRADRDGHAQHVRDPFLQHAAERVERRPPAVQADREIVPLVAVPVGRRVARRRACRDRPCAAASGSAAAARPGCRTRRSTPAARPSPSSAAITAPSGVTAIFCGRNSISAARASIGSAAAPRMCRSRISRQLVDEQRRHVDALAKQRDVRRLERRRGGDPLAEPQPDAVVLARVGVGDRRELARARPRRAAPRSASRAARARRRRIRGSARARAAAADARRKSSVSVSRPSAPTVSSR